MAAVARGGFFPPLKPLKQCAKKAVITAGRATDWSALRSPVRHRAADDGGHAENSARTPEQTKWQNRTGMHLGDNLPNSPDVA